MAADTPLMWRMHRGLGRLLYRLKVEGEENLPQSGPCIIAFNHAGDFVDGMTIAVVMHRRTDVVSFGARELPSKNRFIRQALQRGDHEAEPAMLSAYKARGASAVELMKALDILKKEKAILLAAEGELSWDGTIQYPLAPGTAWMALRAHVPVVLAVSIGGYDIQPRWANYPRLSGRATIRISQPFYVSDAPVSRATNEMVAQASEKIYERMVSVFTGGPL